MVRDGEGNPVGPEGVEKLGCAGEGKRYLLRLRAVVCHSGRSLNSGHYYAFCKGLTDLTIEWPADDGSDSADGDGFQDADAVVMDGDANAANDADAVATDAAGADGSDSDDDGGQAKRKRAASFNGPGMFDRRTDGEPVDRWYALLRFLCAVDFFFLSGTEHARPRAQHISYILRRLPCLTTGS